MLQVFWDQLLKMEALHSLRTSENTLQMSQHHIQQDLNPQLYHCANPKSHAFTEHYKACAFYEGSSVALPCNTLYGTI